MNKKKKRKRKKERRVRVIIHAFEKNIHKAKMMHLASFGPVFIVAITPKPPHG
jgi:hypothetical protein